MTDSVSTISIPVDLANPGQFFACCGLFELADRVWPNAEGWFDARQTPPSFHIETMTEASLSRLLAYAAANRH